MGLITEDMRNIVESAKLCFAATICADGSPNLSPKGSLRVLDDRRLVFMDIDSPNTVENVRADGRMEINVIDFIKRRGYRFKGTAEIRGSGDPAYEGVRQWLLDLHGPAYPANQAIVLNVERVLPVLSPAYTFGNADEGELAEAWASIYGVDGATADETAPAPTSDS